VDGIGLWTGWEGGSGCAADESMAGRNKTDERDETGLAMLLRNGKL